MRHIGFTGSSEGITGAQYTVLRQLLENEHGSYLHHGDCVGADSIAHDMARECGLRIIVHPPKNPRARAYRMGDATREPDEYLVRNRHIVEASDLLIAVPRLDREIVRSGTWATVRYARKRGIPIQIILPNGTVRKE